MRRLFRLICLILYKVVGQHLPAAWSKADIFSISVLRDFLCRHIVRKCGKHVIFGPRVEFSSDMEISDYCGIGMRVVIERDVTIGRNVTIAREAIIYTSVHYFTETELKGVGIMPKVIEDNVYIGTRAIILPGCSRIGKGAIIGAGAVVTKDVPEMTLVTGTPAQVIGPRRNTYQEALARGENVEEASRIGRIERKRKKGDWLT
jgi:maltose O-acetyltransferase